MAEFTMPSLGADMDEGTLVHWLIAAGDEVERGQIVAVVETNKGAIDVEIFTEGRVLELLVPEGRKLPVGTVLALIVGPDEDEAGVRAAYAGRLTQRESGFEPVLEPAPEPPPSVSPTGARERVSPRARKLARDHGLDLHVVTAAHPGAAITGDDVLASEDGEHSRALDPTAMRRAIAAAMTRSKAEIPHYYLTHAVDLEPALAWLEAHNRDVPLADRVLPIALWVRALALALRRMPEFNGWWRAGEFVASEGVHVGLAMSLRGGGLVNPALRDADQADLPTLGARIRELGERARGSQAGRLRASELNAASITLTSLGERGVDVMIPIIEPPQVAIVGLGTPRLRPWLVEGAVVPRRVVELSLAADHRANDGHAGARLLAQIATFMQEPERLA